MSDRTLRDTPYKGLVPYGEEDEPYFFGRRSEQDIIEGNLMGSRLTLLYGPSGVGKSSVLRAGVAADVRSQSRENVAAKGVPRFVLVIFRDWKDDPLAGLLHQVRDAVTESFQGKPFKPVPSNLSFADELREWADRIGGKLLIVLDQFEEYFLYPEKKNGTSFADQFPRAVNQSDLRVNFLISIREDWLAKLDRFKVNVPSLFDNYLRMDDLEREAATEAIEQPISRYNEVRKADEPEIILHKDFAGSVLDQLEKLANKNVLAESGSGQVQEKGESERVSTRIQPPHLQLVMIHLWRQAVANNDHELRPDMLDDPNTAETIIHSHLEEVMKGLDDDEREAASRVFNHLVTPSGIKIAQSLPDLAGYANLSRSQVAPMLKKLSSKESGILSQLAPPPGQPNEPRFEIYHDVLAPAIVRWCSGYKSAKELREAHERTEQQRLVAKQQSQIATRLRWVSAGLIALIVVLIGIGVGYLLSLVRENERILTEANLRDPFSYTKGKAAFDNLYGIWGFGGRAKRLWAGAWKRRANISEEGEYQDEALISWLRAAAEDPNNVDAALTAQINSLLTSDDYQPLMATYRLESDGSASGSRSLFSADGKRLLGITKDFRVIFWDVGSSQPKAQSPPLDLTRCKSPDDRFNVVQQANVLPSSPIERGFVPNISIESAAGNLIGGVNGQTACVWDVVSGEVLFPREARESFPTNTNSLGSRTQASISVSPDGNYFASVNGLKQGVLYKVWGKSVELIYRELGPVESIIFSPDKRTVLFVQTSVVKLLDLENSAWKILPLSPRKEYRRMLFNSDGSKLLVETGLRDQPELWDIASGTLQKRINAPAGGRFAEFYFCGTNLLALVDKDTFDENREILTITLLNTDTNSVVSTRTSLIPKASYRVSSSQSAILLIPATGVARLLSFTPRPPGSKLINDPDGMILQNISDDGQVIATVNQHNVVKVWNAKDVTMSSTFQVPGLESSQLDQLLVSAKGRYLCFRRQDGRLIVWDNHQQRQILEDESSKDDFGRLVSFSDDDSEIAITGPGKDITFWQDGHVVKYPLSEDPTRIQLSPDGRYLTAIYDYSNIPVRVFDTGSAFFEQRLPVNVTPKIALGANGTFMAPTANDNELLVLKLSNFVQHTLKHSSTVTALALSRDGSRAVTSTSDRNLYLWDTTNGTLITTGKLGATIKQLSISNDGKSILAFSDSWIHLYSIQASGLEYVDGRLVGIRDLPRILDNSGQNLRLIVPLSSGSLEVDDISFAPSPDAKLLGSPKDLLETWQRKLSLSFDERGALAQLVSEVVAKPTWIASVQGAYRPGH